MEQGGLSRRQFLILGGGGLVAVSVGGIAFLRNTAGGSVAGGPTLSGIEASALRAVPFNESFANSALPDWNVRRPVAILGTTPFGVAIPANADLDRADFLRGRGTVVGLDGALNGSTGPGLIETTSQFAFHAGSTYELAFSAAGSHQSADRMPPSTVTASLPGLGVTKRVTLTPQAGFNQFTLTVPVARPAASTIVFSSENAPGQAGVLLEAVSLTQIR